MSADQRIVQARELLDAITPYPVATRPHSVLMREDADLRWVLAQLLTLVDDYQAEEREHDVTGLTPSGGARISPTDLLTVLGALSDAAYCGEQDDHDGCPGAAAVAAYRSLGRSLGEDL
jgi:hypothetical protein